MTDDDRQLLIFVAVKQVRIESLLAASIPILSKTGLSQDPAQKAIADKVSSAFRKFAVGLNRQGVSTLQEQFPQHRKLIEEMASVCDKDLVDFLKTDLSHDV
jgi:hypothetical protein